MYQPPDDPFYNAPTDNGNYPPQQWNGQAPRYPQPFSPPNYPPQQGYPPNQGPGGQTGFPPQGYPPNQWPSGQPSFSPQGYPQQRPAPDPYPPQSPAWPEAYPTPQGPYGYPGQAAQNFPPPGTYVSPFANQAPPTSWPNFVPPSNPKKTKKGSVAIISIIVVLTLVIVGAGAFFMLKGKPTGTGQTPTAQGTSTNTGTTPTSGGDTTPGVGTLNQPLQAGPNWVVTLTHVGTTTASSIPPQANHTYLEIALTIHNTSTTKQPISSILQFTLVDANGGKYTESLTDTNIRHTPDGTVNAGQTLHAQLAYEVPTSQHAFILSFDYGLTSGTSASVSWQFKV